MNTQQAQAQFDAKIDALSIAEASRIYRTLRRQVQTAPTPDARLAMVLTGNALERRIGEEGLERLMDEVDGKGGPL